MILHKTILRGAECNKYIKYITVKKTKISFYYVILIKYLYSNHGNLFLLFFPFKTIFRYNNIM